MYERKKTHRQFRESLCGVKVICSSLCGPFLGCIEACCPIVSRSVAETTELLRKESSQGSDENGKGELWKKKSEKNTATLEPSSLCEV